MGPCFGTGNGEVLVSQLPNQQQNKTQIFALMNIDYNSMFELDKMKTLIIKTRSASCFLS